MLLKRTLGFLALAAHCVGLNVESGSLRVNGLIAPMGMTDVQPQLSWRLESSLRNDSQMFYQVQAATSTTSLLGDADLWDSGKVASQNSQAIYLGPDLTSRTTVYWRVRSWYTQNHKSGWSEISTFEMGLLDPDWAAEWIGNPDYSTGNTSLPMLATGFDNTCTNISSARLYIVGLGMHAAYINGHPVGDDILPYGYADESKTIYYSTYDVRESLTTGDNVLGVELGKSIYDPEEPLGDRYAKFTRSPKQLMLRAQLEYSCDGMTQPPIITDASWKSYLNGPYIETSWYGGEEYNATLEIADWSSKSDNLNQWDNASVFKGPSGSMTGSTYPPLKMVEQFPAVSLSGLVNGSYVFDFGTNIAGWYSLKINEPAGTRVVIRTGEKVVDGILDQSTVGGNIYDAYTSNGQPATYQPKFLYHGFRYLSVNLTGPPDSSDAVALAIRASSEPVGHFNSSDAMLNSIHRIIDRAIQGNMYSVFTDCPHREKLGWLEQNHLVFDSLALNYDIQAMGRATMKAMVDAQTDEGMIPTIAPYNAVLQPNYRHDVNWGNTIMVMAWQLYQAYGDFKVLQENYGAMQRYVDYVSNRTTNYILDGTGLGDWITFDNRTPKNYTATFGYYQAVNTLADIAMALGESEDAKYYTALKNSIGDAWNAHFFDTANSSYGPTQADNALAIQMGIVDPEVFDDVVAKITSDVVSRKNHLSVGEIGLPALFIALQAAGRDDLIYEIVTNPTSPSYAYQVLNGATSLNERWDGQTAGRSLNHFMLGYVDKWIFALSGVRQGSDSLMWSSIEFDLIFVGNMTFAASNYRSARGLIGASWQRSDEQLTYNITVPVGSTGTVMIRGYNNVTESGSILNEDSLGTGISKVWRNGTTHEIVVGSGTYYFQAY